MLDFKTYDYNERATYLNSKKAQDPNKIVSVWEDDSSGNIVFNTIEFVGDEAFPSPKVNVREDWDTHVPTAIQLSNDTYAIATVNYVGGNRLTEIHIHAEDGTQLSTTEIQIAGDDLINNQMVDMGNGTFVLHYQLHDDFPGDSPMAQGLQILDYDGNRLGDNNIYLSGLYDNQRSDIVALGEDTIATIYQDLNDGTLQLQVLTLNTDYNFGGVADKQTTEVHTFVHQPNNRIELIETETGALILFPDENNYLMAEINSSGQMLNSPRPILTDVDNNTVLTVAQIDDKFALAYSRGDQAYDESEVFFSVVNASDLSVGSPNKKLQTVQYLQIPIF